MNRAQFYNVIEKWQDLCEIRTDLKFGELAFNKDKFVALVKETMETIREYKKKALDIENNIAEVKGAI